MDRRSSEKIIVFIYSVYALALMFATTILDWPLWINPITSIGIVAVWIVFLRSVKNYRFRALFYSAIVLATFMLYNTQEDSFAGILSTYCAAVVVLSILDIPDIVIPEYIFSVLLIAYHGLISKTIPMATTQERIRSAIQILSVFAVMGIIHHLIEKHVKINKHMSKVIAELKDAEQGKMDFLVNVLNEFKAPVSVVSDGGEMILHNDIPGTIRQDALNIRSAGRKMLSMINDVLDYSALESGRMEVVEAPYNPAFMINEVINMAVAHRGDKDIELIVDCSANIPSLLMGDELKVCRVIRNLVDNGVKFTQSGCVTITVFARPEKYGVNLCVKVKDTGIGISQEHQERLFNIFDGVSGNDKQDNAGIGIGLAISKRLVSSMKGFISVKSELGKGSEFQFVVPQKVLDQRPIASVKNAENTSVIVYLNMEKEGFARIRDDYMSRVCHMLEGLGLRYHLCRNLEELKRRTEKERFTHALIAWDEYSEDRVFFQRLSKRLKIIVINKSGKTFRPGSNIRTLQKPFYVSTFAALLNSMEDESGGDAGFEEEREFSAPEASALVADDNMMNLKVMEDLLHWYGIKVVGVSSGEECLKKLDSIHFDLIFMDHMMPDMDGVETAHRIRKKRGDYFRNVPIIALTANDEQGARDMFISEGFQGYIAKPVDIACLERVLLEHLPENKIMWTRADTAGEAAESRETKPHINYEIGIRRMGGSAEDYRDILKVYLSEGQENYKKISQLYEAEDWRGYTILVHSLKSNSFGIGAERLGEMAKELESACKERDVDYIHANHPEMMRIFDEVLREISVGQGQQSQDESAGCADGRGDKA